MRLQTAPISINLSSAALCAAGGWKNSKLFSYQINPRVCRISSFKVFGGGRTDGRTEEKNSLLPINKYMLMRFLSPPDLLHDGRHGIA